MDDQFEMFLRILVSPKKEEKYLILSQNMFLLSPNLLSTWFSLFYLFLNQSWIKSRINYDPNYHIEEMNDDDKGKLIVLYQLYNTYGPIIIAIIVQVVSYQQILLG